MVKKYVVNPIMSKDQVKSMDGQFVEKSHYKLIINHDADVYWNDNGKERLLFHFRKKIIPEAIMNKAFETFKTAAMKGSSYRGVAGGPAEASKIGGNVKDVLSKGKFKSRVIFSDGHISDYYKCNKVKSIIAGYFDKPKISDRSMVLKKNLVPCRTTIFTEKYPEQWNNVMPFFQEADKLYKKFETKTHSKQLKLAKKTPQYQIGKTAFSTLTVNYNWRTACHVDAGDYINGYTVIMVAEKGKWDGGFLGYPRFAVAVDVRNGDFLLKDPHQQHCNTKLTLHKDAIRLSFVLYYRQNIEKCAKQKSGTVIQKGGGALELITVNKPKKNLDLSVYIRPNTTDIKVIKEVLETNTYEKPRMNFTLESGENWLDLGGNIGTFSLLALSRGCSVDIYEPEKTNLALLRKNLVHNFKISKKWKINDAVVSATNQKKIDLYLCKGDYNKYRHTIYHKRGRKSVSVRNVNIKDLLKKNKFQGIKMDIEGAEIDLLEYLTAADYRKAGVKKLVYEYSFDIDPSIPRFMKIINQLKKYFTTVHFTKVNPNEAEYRHFPAATMVYCMK